MERGILGQNKDEQSMTALRKYARLEASGLWRAHADAQRRDVIVSIGDATLVISDASDRPLAHWSLAAIERDGSKMPAVYYPDGARDETLELAENEKEMVEAIETLRRAIDRARPHPGRLRWLGAGLSVALVAALALFWVPGALVDHAVRVVPSVKRAEIGSELLQRVTRVSGPVCSTPGAYLGLQKLAQRTGVDRIMVVPDGAAPALYLPGGTVLLNKSVITDFDDPSVAAGYVVAERVRMDEDAALRALLEVGGVRASATLLTTGALPAQVLDTYAETAMSSAPDAPAPAALLPAFESAELRSAPYAFARDLRGDSTRALIEDDPWRNSAPREIMRDAEWLQLQDICAP